MASYTWMDGLPENLTIQEQTVADAQTQMFK